jgi:hypothetical protein
MMHGAYNDTYCRMMHGAYNDTYCRMMHGAYKVFFIAFFLLLFFFFSFGVLQLMLPEAPHPSGL